MPRKRFYTPDLCEDNVRRLYRVSQKFQWSMSRMLNHIVATALEELEHVNPDEWEIAEPVRPEQPACSTVHDVLGIIKAMQGHLTADNVLPVLDKVWHWTKVTLNEAAIVATTMEAQDQKEAPQEDFPPRKEAGKITDKQQKRLFAIAKRVGMSNDRLKAFLKEGYGIESTKDIPWQQYNEICGAVESNSIPF